MCPSLTFGPAPMPICSGPAVSLHYFPKGSARCSDCGAMLRCTYCGWFVRFGSRILHVCPEWFKGTQPGASLPPGSFRWVVV